MVAHAIVHAKLCFQFRHSEFITVFVVFFAISDFLRNVVSFALFDEIAAYEMSFPIDFPRPFVFSLHYSTSYEFTNLTFYMSEKEIFQTVSSVDSGKT